MIHACLNDHFNVVRILRGYEVDFNRVDEFGITPLHAACMKSKNQELMEFLVRQGAFFSFTRSGTGKTILHSAAEVGNVDGIEFSLTQGFDVDIRDDAHMTPLALAATSCDNYEGLDRLVAAGADIDFKDEVGNSILHLAVLQKNVAGVKFSLEKGLRVGHRNSDQDTALDEAHLKTASQDIFDLLRAAYWKELPRCCFCSDAPSHVQFKPCRHQVACDACCEKWRKCMCGVEIEKKIDVIHAPYGEAVVASPDQNVFESLAKTSDELLKVQNQLREERFEAGKAESVAEAEARNQSEELSKLRKEILEERTLRREEKRRATLIAEEESNGEAFGSAKTI